MCLAPPCHYQTNSQKNTVVQSKVDAKKQRNLLIWTFRLAVIITFPFQVTSYLKISLVGSTTSLQLLLPVGYISPITNVTSSRFYFHITDVTFSMFYHPITDVSSVGSILPLQMLLPVGSILPLQMLLPVGSISPLQMLLPVGSTTPITAHTSSTFYHPSRCYLQ